MALQNLDEPRQILQKQSAHLRDDPISRNSAYGLAYLAGDSTAMAAVQQWYGDHPQYENWGWPWLPTLRHIPVI